MSTQLPPDKFIHCPHCADHNLEPSLAAGVTAMGDLVLRCQRHDEVIGYFENGKIQEHLMKIAAVEADCGHKQREH